MAYRSHDLSILSYANGFTLWHYTTQDAEGVVNEVGYFDDASDMVRVGDMMMTNMNTNGPPESCILLVNTVNAGVGMVELASGGSDE